MVVPQQQGYRDLAAMHAGDYFSWKACRDACSAPEYPAALLGLAVHSRHRTLECIAPLGLRRPASSAGGGRRPGSARERTCTGCFADRQVIFRTRLRCQGLPDAACTTDLQRGA